MYCIDVFGVILTRNISYCQNNVDMLVFFRGNAVFLVTLATWFLRSWFDKSMRRAPACFPEVWSGLFGFCSSLPHKWTHKCYDIERSAVTCVSVCVCVLWRSNFNFLFHEKLQFQHSGLIRSKSEFQSQIINVQIRCRPSNSLNGTWKCSELRPLLLSAEVRSLEA